MKKAPDTLRRELSQAIRCVVLTLPVSQAEIARRLGKTRAAVNGWVNKCEMPGAATLMGLSRLASSLGDHRLARLFCLPQYDVLAVAVSPGWAPSGSHLDELDRVVRALGEASRATENGEIHRAEALLSSAQTARVEWSRELAHAVARAA